MLTNEALLLLLVGGGGVALAVVLAAKCQPFKWLRGSLANFLGHGRSMFGHERYLPWSIIAPKLPFKCRCTAANVATVFVFFSAFFCHPPRFVAHLDLLLKILLDRMWSDVLSRWPLSVLSVI